MNKLQYTFYTDKMEFHVIELPKLPKELKEDASDMLLCAKFINSKTKEEFEMLAEKNKSIAEAYQQLQVISQDEQKQLEYDARQKAIWDYNQGMTEAEERGEQRGLKQGKKEGGIQYQHSSYYQVGGGNLYSFILCCSAL